MLADPLAVIMDGTKKAALELRGVMLRMPLARKNVQGCARAAIRSNEVDDIRKGDVAEWVVVGIDLDCS